jgi:hypothetical protein
MQTAADSSCRSSAEISRVPAATKARLRQDLRQIGISRSYLFPDLENLAVELSEWHSEEFRSSEA